MADSQSDYAGQHRHTHPVLPEPLWRNPDGYGVHWRHLPQTATRTLLSRHFDHPETMLLSANGYIAPAPKAEYTVPELAADLRIVFGVAPGAASGATATSFRSRTSPGLRAGNRALLHRAAGSVQAARCLHRPGHPRYRRFDETGCHHGTGRAGDRLGGWRLPAHGRRGMSCGAAAGLCTWTCGGATTRCNGTIRTRNGHIATFDDKYVAGGKSACQRSQGPHRNSGQAMNRKARAAA